MGPPVIEPPWLSANLTVRAGSFTIAAELAIGPADRLLVGPNGAGKTTTLLALLGLRAVERGRITAGTRTLFDSDRLICLPTESRRLGWVPHDLGLFPHLTALGNVTFALGCAANPPARSAREGRARALLDALGVGTAADRKPAALSAGQRQRVVLARALAADPVALLLDEPFAAIDVEARADVRATVIGELRARRCPFLLVTHDPDDATAIDAPLSVMEGGRIVQTGRMAELRAAPATAYVRRFTA
jgi:molybdate transport system ATP-binding protein